MTFDFQKRFANYTTVDLINIINNSSDYQPAAVEAASQILKERNVTETEIRDMQQTWAKDKTAANPNANNTVPGEGEIIDLLEPAVQPAGQLNARKWVNILLIVLAVQYMWVLYVYGWNLLQVCAYLVDCARSGFDAFGQCAAQFANVSFLIELFVIAYTPIVVALIIKRKKLGWMLEFIVNLIAIISRVSTFYFYLKYQYAAKGNIFLVVLPLMIRVAFVYFLWRDEIAAYFNISEETKKKTATVTSLISLFYIGILVMRS